MRKYCVFPMMALIPMAGAEARRTAMEKAKQRTSVKAKVANH